MVNYDIKQTACVLLNPASALSFRLNKAAGFSSNINPCAGPACDVATFSKEDPLSLNDCFKVQHVAFLGNRHP